MSNVQEPDVKIIEVRIDDIYIEPAEIEVETENIVIIERDSTKLSF